MSGTLRLSGCVGDSIVDGPGMRFVVFVQGCPHGCPKCQNPQTHDFAGGQVVEIDAIVRQIARDPLACGVTFSGGEPFCQAKELCELAEAVKALGKDIVVYSGYTHEQLIQLGEKNPEIPRLLSLCDTLIDGKYDESQRDLTLPFRGSRNQRIIALHEKTT